MPTTELLHHFHVFPVPHQDLATNCRVVVLTDADQHLAVTPALCATLDGTSSDPQPMVRQTVEVYEPHWSAHRVLSCRFDTSADAGDAACALAALLTRSYKGLADRKQLLDKLGNDGADLLFAQPLGCLFHDTRDVNSPGNLHLELGRALSRVVQTRVEGLREFLDMATAARSLDRLACATVPDVREGLQRALRVTHWTALAEQIQALDGPVRTESDQVIRDCVARHLEDFSRQLNQLLPVLLEDGCMARTAWLALLPVMANTLVAPDRLELQRRVAMDVVWRDNVDEAFVHSFATMVDCWAGLEGRGSHAAAALSFFCRDRLDELIRSNSRYARLFG